MNKLPRVMITAPQSGAGKTTVVCGILLALKRRGLQVGAFKCGPDYIDPMFHTRTLGIESRNLDPFLMGRDGVQNSLLKNGKDKDVCIIEGAMGYYDGLGGISTKASAYEMHQITSSPVVMVVDCKGMSLSIAAVIKGFLEFRLDSGIAGVILNKISPAVYENLKGVLEQELPIRVLGFLPNDEKLCFESRHLGLCSPKEQKDIDDKLEKLSEIAQRYINLDLLLDIAENAAGIHNVTQRKICAKHPLTIAVARDEAFSFYYEDNLDLLREYGCKLLFFSPLYDKKVPSNAHGLLIGGGYPEIFVKELSKNHTMLQSIYDTIVKDNIPTIAECGGFLYLHEALEDNTGQEYPMAGVIRGRCFATQRLVRFGYVTLTSNRNGWISPEESIPAHSFHYWDSENNGNALTARKPLVGREWKTGHMTGSLWAGFSHIHFYGAPMLLESFLGACKGVK